MKFGKVPVADAEGAVLAHATQATNQPHDLQMVYRIPKGTILTRTHIEDLQAEGHQTVIVARLEPDDLDENEAAMRLAAALVPSPQAAGVRITSAATGRVNIYAETAGVVNINTAAVNAFNAVHPMITVATLRPYQRVEVGTMIATVKIIAYGVPQNAVATVQAVSAGALSVLPPMFLAATLIETATAPGDPPDKGRRVMAGRLHRLGMWLTDRVVVPHTEVALAQALADAEGEVVFVLTGSATSDPDDVGPQALRVAGGEVTQFGMPVDPGNLLFLGKLGERPVIGLPGCARSPALNGADWVIERVICGVQLTPADFAAMGVGGLLKEIPTRPKPRGDIEN